MKDLQLKDIPIKVRLKAWAYEQIFGWCMVVKTKEGKFEIHYHDGIKGEDGKVEVDV